MEPQEQASIDVRRLLDAVLDGIKSIATGEDAPADEPPPDVQLLQSVRGWAAEERIRASTEVNETYRQRVQEMTDVVAERQNRLEAYARRQRQSIPAVKGRFVVAGRVTDQSSGVGLPHVRVRASDLDRKHDDLLGEARTDALGYFRIEYDPSDFKDKDMNPEAYIEVLDDEGEVVHRSTRSFVEKSGETAFIAAPVDGQRLPKHLQTGVRVSEGIQSRENDLALRGRVLSNRPEVVATTELRVSPPFRETPQRITALIEEDPRRIPLSDISGIGPVYKERLEKEGLGNAGSVAATDPKRLATILDVGEGRAKAIGEAARRTMESRRK